MESYLHLFRHHGRILTFGVLLAFFSSFGQTFFISLSAPLIIETFNFSNAGWGGLYSLATLLSALCLPYCGKIMDRISLLRFSIAIALGLAVSSLTLGLAPHTWVLLLALIGLRLTGQGLFGLTSATTMARAFDIQRGSALSISSVGFPLGEILFPPLALLVLGGVGWRAGWMVFATFIMLVLIPLIWWLISDAQRLPAALRQSQKTHARENPTLQLTGWTRTEMLKNYRVYFLLPVYVMPGFLATGLILHQALIAQEKGWSVTVMASSFVAFGGTRLVFALLIGPMIDRFSAARIFPMQLVPLIAGVLVLNHDSEPTAALIYYGLMGTTLGIGGSASSALWAEIYGVRHLGSIKSLMSMAAILCTAISPLALGWLLDQGVRFQTLFPLIAMGMGCFSLLSLAGCRRNPKPARKGTT